MCERGERLKLCTCGGEVSEVRPHWILRRPTGPDMMIMGELASPAEDVIWTGSKLLQDLNRPDAFDFDPALRDGDELTIVLMDRAFLFSHQGGVWYARTLAHQGKTQKIGRGPLRLA